MQSNKKLQLMDKAFNQLKSSYKLLREQYLLTNYGAESEFCIGVSAGHGGYDLATNKYSTAPSKMHLHIGEVMHNGGFFYEGAFNRIIADKFCALLKKNKMVYKKFYHPHDDWKLSEKTAMINHHHINVKPVLLFDLHSNASKKHNARGFSVYTSPGQTESDKLATKLWEEMDKIKGVFGFSMRKETWTDNDVDYEERFWMLIKTACPSILPEFLFFDNINDARILMMPSFQDACAESLLNTAIWGNKKISA